MGTFLQFKRQFHNQPYFSIIFIHVQLFFIYVQHLWCKKQPQKKKTDSSNKYVANSNIKLT